MEEMNKKNIQAPDPADEALKKTVNGFNLSEIIANIEQVKKIKASKQKKPSASIRPLKFKPSPEDSPLKAEIVRRINEKNLTYGDLHNYCAKIRNGNIAEGQTLGNNMITGLKNRHSFTDTTLSILADFLNLDIAFIERPTPEESDDEKDEGK